MTIFKIDMKSLKVDILFMLLSLVFLHEVLGSDLYDVLGVRKTASQKEIKQAYKKLAKEWHPDKTDDPEATDKFTKINEAYETLGDPENRRKYDNYGYTAASRDSNRQQHQGFHGFEDFFSSGPFGFNFHFGGDFGGGAESIIDKHLITMRQYETVIFPSSNQKPCILYGFSDFCFNCLRIEALIEKFIQELNNVGFCVGTFHHRRSGGLESHLRISGYPAILGVVNERVTHYKGGVNMQLLRDFARDLFPSDTFKKISDANMKEFLDGWPDNKVRAIFFGQRKDPTARFLAPAFYYKGNVAFGYVYVRNLDTENLLKNYTINGNRETLLMFNEDTKSPVATISMQQLPRRTLDEVIEGNKYLMLPRLSSQKFFDQLCPPVYKVKNRKLCIVLITRKVKEHDSHRQSFRKFAQRSSHQGNDRIKFTYIYEETQGEFVKALKREQDKDENADGMKKLKVAIVWRVEEKQLRYDWLETGWDITAEKEKLCATTLENRLNVLLTTDGLMPYRITLPGELYNEHGYHLLMRIGFKLINWAERVASLFTGYDTTTWVTIGLSVVFVVGMGYFMHKLATIEEEQVQMQRPRKQRPPARSFDERSVQLYEIRSSTYVDLVSNADTGLTITLLVDKESKDLLLQQFVKIVYPYSRYSALTFAFLQLEYYIHWYRHLLEESLEGKVQLSNINIKNCVGTVLALNGYRKYFYVYSIKKARMWIRQKNNVSEALGFDDLDEQSEDEDWKKDYFFVEELLEGLAIWMDKIFDGSIKRIRVENWPEMTDL